LKLPYFYARKSSGLTHEMVEGTLPCSVLDDISNGQTTPCITNPPFQGWTIWQYAFESKPRFAIYLRG